MTICDRWPVLFLCHVEPFSQENIPKELKERYAGVAGAESGRGGGEAINQITINFTISAVASLKLCFHFLGFYFFWSVVFIGENHYSLKMIDIKTFQH